MWSWIKSGKWWFEIGLPIVLLPLLVSCGGEITKDTVPLQGTGSKVADAELLRSYSEWGGEAERLFTKPQGIIERLRTESILRRFAPKAPAVMYDIGGGAGVYAFPLAQQGYSVHLIDIVPLHIEQAKKRMEQTAVKLVECTVGDARSVQAKDAVADVVLLFGPLYHLQEKQDRLKALREAYRILKPGGMLFAAAMPRAGLFFSEADKGRLKDPYFASLVEQTLKTGVYFSPKSKNFSTGYFHEVDEFEVEVKQAGFNDVQLLIIEGPMKRLSSIDETIQDQQSLNALLHFLELIEKNRNVMGAGGHIMAIGKK